MRFLRNVFRLLARIVLFGRLLPSGRSEGGIGRRQANEMVDKKLHVSLVTARKDLARITAALEAREERKKPKPVSVDVRVESRAERDIQNSHEPFSDVQNSELAVKKISDETLIKLDSDAQLPEPAVIRRISRGSSVYEPRIEETDEEVDEDEDVEYVIYQECFDEYNIEYLYHMTHVDNLPGILRNGLLSHNKAHRNQDPVDISMGEVNKRRLRQEPIFGRSLHDYVPLYFNAKNPMLYKRKDISDQLAIIHFNRDLLLKNKVLFTDGNAASSATEFYHELSDLDEVDWDTIWARSWNDIDDGKRKRCAEVIVPKKIGIKHIEKIAVSSKMTLNEIDRKTRNKADFVVDSKLFSWNDSGASGRSSSGYGSSAWA